MIAYTACSCSSQPSPSPRSLFRRSIGILIILYCIILHYTSSITLYEVLYSISRNHQDAQTPCSESNIFPGVWYQSLPLLPGALLLSVAYDTTYHTYRKENRQQYTYRYFVYRQTDDGAFSAKAMIILCQAQHGYIAMYHVCIRSILVYSQSYHIS